MYRYIKIFFNTLDKNHKKQLSIMSIIIFLSVFFDTMGIGMIIPIINILIDNNLIDKFPFLSPVFNLLGNPDEKVLLLYFVIFLALIFLIKNFFLGLLTWKKSYFTYSIQNFYSKKLMNIYLKKPYSFHVNNNSSKLINTIVNETSLASGQFIISIIDLVIDAMIIAALFFLLLSVEPIITISMILIFIFFGSLYFFLVKQKLLKYGYIRQKTYADQLKLYKEIFSNIKFFLIHKKTKKVIDEISVNLNKIKDFNVKYIFISAFPKLLFEYIIIIIFCLLIISFIYSEFLLIENLIPSLALFSAAAFRMLPSSNKILLSLQKIKYSKSAIELIYEEIKNDYNEKLAEKTDLSFNFKKLSLKNLSFKYESANKFLFKDISLDISKGKIYGITGLTGSGKTTLADIIMCLNNKVDGKILLNDSLNLNEYKNSWQKLIGYVPQNIYLLDDTIKNNIAFGEFSNDIDEATLLKSIKLAKLEKLINNLEKGYDTNIGENGSKLSGGQIQRVGIARALYANPQVLILDEITSSLDVNTEEEIIDVIKNLKGEKTIILITHRLNMLKICDDVFELNNGLLIKIKN
jgi:ABC-type multidrug transport system fused ATPase/permease subunit